MTSRESALSRSCGGFFGIPPPFGPTIASHAFRLPRPGLFLLSKASKGALPRDRRCHSRNLSLIQFLANFDYCPIVLWGCPRKDYYAVLLAHLKKPNKVPLQSGARRTKACNTLLRSTLPRQGEKESRVKRCWMPVYFLQRSRV